MNKVRAIIRNSMLCSSAIHLMRFLIFSSYRQKRSLVKVPAKFFYIHGRAISLLLYPLLKVIAFIIARKKILVSVHNISAVGHIYPEIDLLIRFLDRNTSDRVAEVWYVMPSDPLIFDLRLIFERERLKLKLNGLLHLILNLVMLIDKRQAICVSQSSVNYTNGVKSLSVCDVFAGRQYHRAISLAQEPFFFPLRRYGDSQTAPFVHELLGISNHYVILQIKDRAINGTFKPVDPQTYLPSLAWIKTLGYDLVFAGREEMPKCFNDLIVFNYSESIFANPISDYMLVLNANFIVGSASGFCLVPELLDKPLLSINAWQHVGYVGRKTILIPTLLLKDGVSLSYESQRVYSHSSNPTGEGNVPLDKNNYEALDASANDILLGSKELIHRIRQDDWGYSSLQQMVKVSSPHSMLGVGLSRISHDFLVNNRSIFFDD